MPFSFSEVLQQLDTGKIYAELGSELAKVVEAVKETRKVGELSFVLKLKPNGDNSMFVAATIKPKVPQRPSAETLFYVTATGNLMRTDPRQPDLPLRRIEDNPVQPLRFINGTLVDGDGVIIEQGVA